MSENKKMSGDGDPGGGGGTGILAGDGDGESLELGGGYWPSGVPYPCNPTFNSFPRCQYLRLWDRNN